MKLSLMVPTFNSGETIERTLLSVIAQTHRPLEVVVYDEASVDDTRRIVRDIITRAPEDISARFITSENNSGPVEAWRILLHEITGDWCAFVWADDVLEPEYSEHMIAGAERAVDAGRKLVGCSAMVESGNVVKPYYSDEHDVLSAVEYSEAIFTRRIPLTQICAVYETAVAREIFERHIRIENPFGFDFSRYPYGNDVGFLSELAAAGDGVEILGRRLVTLVDSSTSMTRRGGREHMWQMRWQYTYNQYRVWRWWADRGIPGAARVRDMASRRLDLCALMLGGAGNRWRPSSYVGAVRAYLDFVRLDYQRDKHSLVEHRRRNNDIGAVRRMLGPLRSITARSDTPLPSASQSEAYPHEP